MGTISNVDVGATNITTIGTITTGTWQASPIPLAYGGTGANLTPSNGGIFWSNASVLNILAGTATAAQLLMSGANGAPTWSTATYPLTAAISTIFYGTTTNVIGTLAFIESAALCSDGSGVPTWVGFGGVSGAILIGVTGGLPVAGTMGSGNGITVTPSDATMLITAAPVINQSTTSVTMAAGGVYYANNAGLVTLTLATSPVAGDKYTVMGNGAGGWTVAQNASQIIRLPGGVATTAGTGGSLSSNNQYDCVTIVYSEVSNTFNVTNIKGNIIYV